MDKAVAMLNDYLHKKTVHSAQELSRFMEVIMQTNAVFTSEERKKSFCTLAERFDATVQKHHVKNSWGRNEFKQWWSQAVKELQGDSNLPWYLQPQDPGHSQAPQAGKRAPTATAIEIARREKEMNRMAILEEMKILHLRMGELINRWEASDG